ncbi:MAG: Rne/Rng family ribonuclease [Synergistaceae bacterium]|nr:Rne/Rng family ribonuclease [Synergistaceae bacterium]
MDKNLSRKIIADTRESEETRVAIIEGGRLAEIFIERMGDRQKAGEIYKARVDSVLPGISAAFISIGEGRNAFLYLNDAQGMEIFEGQELIVQVTKMARKNKGARVTPRISLPGRYLVLVPGGGEAGVSRRIASDGERKRLRALAKEIRGELSSSDALSMDTRDFGLIVRTAAEGIDAEALKEDARSLAALWRDIEREAENQPAPFLLYRDLGPLGRVLRDEVHGDVDEIIVDSEEELRHVQDFIASHYRESRPHVAFYQGLTPIFEYYGIEAEIEQALDRKVWLKSGAYLVIEPTEALTVIDVNTGKFTGGLDMRHTTLATNLEAADEIARQLRLRSIGGIVVVDFIDMDYEEDRKKLLARLDEVFQADRSRARAFGVTQLGLVEITRKRGRPDLRSTLTRGCPFCSDNGWVLREDTVALSVKRFLRKIAYANRSEAMLIQTNAEIARYIGETYLPAWEEDLSRKILVAGMPDFAWALYRVELQGPLDAVERHARQMERKEAHVIVYRVPAS